MNSLFPQHGANFNSQQSLLQFKAGKCQMARQSNNKYLITPDTQKGLISLTRTSDNVINFQWTDRMTQSVEQSWILFPDDVVYRKVNTGKQDDRVYMLKWKNGERILMFWMQDKSAEKDTENCTKFNELINNPHIHGSAPQDGSIGPEAWMQLLGLGGNTINNRRFTAPPSQQMPPPMSTIPAMVPPGGNFSAFGNLDFSSLIQGAANPSNNYANQQQQPFTTPSTSAPSLTNSDFQRAMSGIIPSRTTTNNAVTLQDILSHESVMSSGILSDPQVRQSLIQHLPPTQQRDDYLDDNLRSPQFRQAVGALDQALHSTPFNAVASNLGIDPTPGIDSLARNNVVEALVTCLQAEANQGVTVQQQEQGQGQNSSAETVSEEVKSSESGIGEVIIAEEKKEERKESNNDQSSHSPMEEEK